MEAFTTALLRDPVRAANIHHITLKSKVYRTSYGSVVGHARTIFPYRPSEQFWKFLEGALSLLVSAKKVKLLASESFNGTHSEYPDRFIDIIGRVFPQLGVACLDAHLPPSVLFQLCGSWSSLTTLCAGGELRGSRVDLSSNTFPHLRHVKLTLDLMCHIVPGRSVETIYHVGEPKGSRSFSRLKTTLRGCKTLRSARVCCCASTKDDSADLLPAFAHDNLREFHLTVELKYNVFTSSSDKPENLQLNESLVMQALAEGALMHFPKLEFLQIVLSHQAFDALHGYGINNVESDATVNAFGALLTSECHATLNRVVISLQPQENLEKGAFRFIATRSGSQWDVVVVGWDSSPLPLLKDVF